MIREYYNTNTIDDKNFMKIVYCLDSIYQLSGMDIVTMTKAEALAMIPGNQVWVVAASNPRSLVHRMKHASMIDLNIHYYEHDNEGLLRSIIDLQKKRKQHRQKLNEFLENVAPDVVISVGVLTKYFLPTMKLSSTPVFIREQHTERHYNLHSATSLFKKMVALFGEFYDYYWRSRAYDMIAVLTERDRDGVWKHWTKVVVMPNPITHETGLVSDANAKIVVTAGRLAVMKNFSAMINIWAKVVRRHPDWVLNIWGIGCKEVELRTQIQRLGLNRHVFLMGYTEEISVEMSKGSIMLLTSLSEGFSLVTLEAMALGIPTVVYNCPGGISHLVKDGVTGYLVQMNDEDAFVKRVCQLIENARLRKAMGQAAKKESMQYNVDNIASRWMDLFHELLDKKRGKN